VLDLAAAVADHGAFRGDTITGTEQPARAVLDELATVKVDYAGVVAALERQGVHSFEEAWNTLIEARPANSPPLARPCAPTAAPPGPATGRPPPHPPHHQVRPPMTGPAHQRRSSNR